MPSSSRRRGARVMAELITRVIGVGDRIRDNDPRCGGQRVLVVEDITDTHAICRRVGGTVRAVVRIRLDRIHTDGRVRRSGFDRIKDDQAQ